MRSKFVELKNKLRLNFIIKYRKKNFNSTNAPLKRSDIIKPNNNENNNDNFLFILLNKLRNQKYQFNS